MKKIALVMLLTLGLVAAGPIPATSESPNEGDRATAPNGHLLDRGVADQGKGTRAPTPIFHPPAGPGATPAPPGFGILGNLYPPGSGAYVGNLFRPGSGYPPTYLTAGGLGFMVTGVFAYQLAPPPLASISRILAAGVVNVPPGATVNAAFTLGPVFRTAAPITGAVSPFGSPVTAPLPSPMPVGPATNTALTAGPVGLFCGLAIGAPGFPPLAAVPTTGFNGLGGISGAMAPPSRAANLPLVTGAFVLAQMAPPAAYIAGCFADSTTVPVELMAFTTD